jgi:hypothetical protein
MGDRYADKVAGLKDWDEDVTKIMQEQNVDKRTAEFVAEASRSVRRLRIQRLRDRIAMGGRSAAHAQKQLDEMLELEKL